MPVKTMVMDSRSLWLVQWGDETVHAMFPGGDAGLSKVVWDVDIDGMPGKPLIEQMQRALYHRPMAMMTGNAEFRGTPAAIQKWDDELADRTLWRTEGDGGYPQRMFMGVPLMVEKRDGD